MKRKSISRWWSILTDELGWLWVNNLLYLLCITPSVICGFLFFSFHAYLFLALAAVAFVIAGPGILAFQKIILDAAVEEPKMVRIRYVAAYRTNLRKGMLLGLVLAVAMILIGMPVYFALSINSPFLPLIVFSCCLSLLLWHSCSSQVLTMICTGGRYNGGQLLREIVEPGIISAVFGLIKLLWIFLLIFAPAFAASLALIGTPAIITFTILYYLYNQGDVSE